MKLHNVLKFLRNTIPFELKRNTSTLSVLLAVILVGFLGQAGVLLFEIFIDIIKSIIPSIEAVYLWASSKTIEMSIASIALNLIIFVFALFPIYRRLDNFFLKEKHNEVVFYDDFDTNRGWKFYGGIREQEISNSLFTFKVTPKEIIAGKNEFGAYLDIRSGIYNGFRYEITCRVKATPNVSMGFQLWVHDTAGGNLDVTKREPPEDFYIPSESYENIKLIYTANSTNAIRIHLNVKPGGGAILIDRVTVRKV